MIVLVPAQVFDELVEPARAAAPNARLVSYEENDAPVHSASEAQAVLRWVAGKRYASLVASGPAVRWLHTASAGVDHVLTPPVRGKAGLVVSDSGPAFAIAIGEFVLAWMLLVARGLPGLIANQRVRRWQAVPQRELFGQSVGVIGLGPIGQNVARLGKALGMKTRGLRRRSKEPVEHVDEVLAGPDGLARLLTQSDFVVLAAALTNETQALMGAAELARMKPSATLINIARGALIDEPALIEALQTGRIAGACLDVFACEPLSPNSPLWDLPNVYLAPHNSSGWTTGLRARQKQLFLDNLARFAQGLPLNGVVDIARGY